MKIIELPPPGTVDPSVLAGADLRRSRFPRLVTRHEEDSPIRETHGNGHEIEDSHEAQATDVGARVVRSANADEKLALVRQQWDKARDRRDLAAARLAYEELSAAVSHVERSALQASLAEFTAAVLEEWRSTFAARVRGRDFGGALKIGKQIVEHFPDSPTTVEFIKLEPILRRRHQVFLDAMTASPLPTADRF